MAPIFVKYTMTKKSLIHLIVRVCAIIGGVFTVAGLIDSILHRSILEYLKHILTKSSF